MVLLGGGTAIAACATMMSHRLLCFVALSGGLLACSRTAGPLTTADAGPAADGHASEAGTEAGSSSGGTGGTSALDATAEVAAPDIDAGPARAAGRSDGAGDAFTIRCSPPYVCPDGGTDDICRPGTGLCGVIEDHYTRAEVEATSCTLNAPDQCLYLTLTSLRYPCAGCDSPVNRIDQLDNFHAQWLAAGCMRCVPANACTNLRCPAPTGGTCMSVSRPTPGGVQTTVECTGRR
jgi:hypothetical protein